MKYGLIGEKLGHSFSKEIHESINTYEYEIHEVAKDEFDDFMIKRDFLAINVTIPYKEKVIPYLDYIDDAAKAIGAVNTIVNQNGKLYGYNTDFLGLRDLVLSKNINAFDKKVVIFGDGGTSKTANAVFKSLGAKSIHHVSLYPSEKACSYEDAKTLHQDTEIIVNATPCGMYPNNDDLIMDITGFNKLEAVVDVIYNPLKTPLVRLAEKMNITTSGGLYMLVAQAVYASSVFVNQEYEKDVIDKIYQKIHKNKENIILIGMPSCGKSTIGKILSTKLNKTFVDSDDEIIEKIKMPISEFLTKDNEKEFRDIEEEVIKNLASKNNLVISTGGGVIKRNNNIHRLKANGIIVFIDRPLALLEATSSRPLSSNKSALEKLYLERYDLYKQAADIVVQNDKELEIVIEDILKGV
ncbi:MAG: shikimate dehydrogenase [Bacilli bacterium]|nr:shikimate dehydrogenase [Bacilli bacterium]